MLSNLQALVAQAKSIRYLIEGSLVCKPAKGSKFAGVEYLVAQLASTQFRQVRFLSPAPVLNGGTMFFSVRRRLNRVDRLFHLVTAAFELYVQREINKSASILDIAFDEAAMEVRLQAVIDDLKSNQHDPLTIKI